MILEQTLLTVLGSILFVDLVVLLLRRRIAYFFANHSSFFATKNTDFETDSEINELGKWKKP